MEVAWAVLGQVRLSTPWAQPQRHCAATDWSVPRVDLVPRLAPCAPELGVTLALAIPTRALTATPSTGPRTERDLPK